MFMQGDSTGLLSRMRRNRRVFSFDRSRTGGGKTLATMTFALIAQEHGQRRVIVCDSVHLNHRTECEGLSGCVFGEDAVLEHHSALEPDKTPRTSNRG